MRERETVRTGVIRKGDHKGSVVREDESLECPRWECLNGETMTVVVVKLNGEVGRIFAVRESEVEWLPNSLEVPPTYTTREGFITWD